MKNQSAVLLGELSAKSRRKKVGKKGMSEHMRALRQRQLDTKAAL
jgi:hypothetical protein